jgi:hypothetical protein
MYIPGWGKCNFFNFPGYTVDVMPASEGGCRRPPPVIKKQILSYHEMQLLSDPLYATFELLKVPTESSIAARDSSALPSPPDSSPLS